MTAFKSVLALAALAIAPALHAAEPLESVPRLDLARYAGTWHEQAHLPMVFQRKCAKNTTATYTVRPDGNIDVLNRCETRDGRAIDAHGLARPVADAPGRLEVRFAPAALSFLPFVWADYWVTDLDPAYRWAVVGEPRRKYLWVLARDKQLPRDELDAIVERAKAKGFATEDLVYTPQQ